MSTWGIMVLWVLSMLLIPILFSFMPEPTQRHLGHLERHWLDNAVEWIVRMSHTRRSLIYAITFFCSVVAFVGVLRMKDESRIVDDLPEDNPVLTDLPFFERNFRGVMPLEIVVDTKKKGMALNDRTLKRIDRLNDTLATYTEFSRALGIADAGKFTKQAFYLGDPERYELIKPNYPPDQFIIQYLEGADQKQDMARGFIDSLRQTARITVQMADVGTTRMDELLTGLRAHVDSIFDPAKYHVTGMEWESGDRATTAERLGALGRCAAVHGGARRHGGRLCKPEGGRA